MWAEGDGPRGRRHHCLFVTQVLENARLVEFGAPGDLLAQGHDGPFSKLVDRTGPAVASHLRAIAQGQAALDFEALQLEKGGD